MEKGFFTKMLNAFLQTVFTWQRKRGRRLGIKNGQTGAISFLQRATGALTWSFALLTAFEEELPPGEASRLWNALRRGAPLQC